MSAAEPLLKVVGLSSGYGRLSILRSVDVEVRRGQIVSIIGPNGAGKSTLLKAVMGFLPTMSGRVDFAGRNLAPLPVEARIGLGLAYVAQTGGSFPGLSVADNLRAGGYQVRGRAELRRRVESVYQQFPVLGPLRHTQAALLSGGERRMLEIGRFLMQSPILVMLDEPSIGLSPQLAGFVYGEIMRLREQHGLTFLIVEQNVREALRISDHVYVLESGHNRFDGPPDSLMAEADLSVLFLGSSLEAPREAR